MGSRLTTPPLCLPSAARCPSTKVTRPTPIPRRCAAARVRPVGRGVADHPRHPDVVGRSVGSCPRRGGVCGRACGVGARRPCQVGVMTRAMPHRGMGCVRATHVCHHPCLQSPPRLSNTHHHPASSTPPSGSRSPRWPEPRPLLLRPAAVAAGLGAACCRRSTCCPARSASAAPRCCGCCGFDMQQDPAACTRHRMNASCAHVASVTRLDGCVSAVQFKQ